MEIVKVILDTIRFIPFIPRSVLFCLIMLSRNRLWTHMPPVVILFVCIDSNSLCNRARLTSQALVLGALDCEWSLISARGQRASKHPCTREHSRDSNLLSCRVSSESCMSILPAFLSLAENRDHSQSEGVQTPWVSEKTRPGFPE